VVKNSSSGEGVRKKVSRGERKDKGERGKKPG
jgi:hypothetical protein